MESLGEILNLDRTLTTTSKANTPTSSNGSVGEDEPSKYICPLCQGVGFVRADVPLEHPDFGRALLCRCGELELEQTRLSRLQRYSNLGPLTRLTFDTVMPRGRNLAPANQERFAHALGIARAFADNPEGWLVLTGVSGCGKTHLAAAIANHRLQMGQPVFFTVTPDLLDHLRSTYSPTSEMNYDELFEQVRGAPLLVLDDLGTQSSTAWAQEKLFQIINHRYNGRTPTVFTTNHTLDSMEERLRTRLADPGLSQVVVVTEGQPSGFHQVGSMGMELLKNMTFESFDVSGLQATPEQQHTLVNAFQNARAFADAPEGWLILLGDIGSGKTHLAAAIANQRLKAGQSAIFMVVPELLDHLRYTFSPDSKVNYDELFERVKGTPLLILDDLGTETSTPWAQEKLYQIINHRYNGRLPTVITTNRALEDIDSRLSSRMADVRLSIPLQIRAPDYRSCTRPAERFKTREKRSRRSRLV
ncbi:MAG: ATP-binding protein [Chloroflexi bacterium]|nr:ATP-binding protein [Chloroflexota bacterium]